MGFRNVSQLALDCTPVSGTYLLTFNSYAPHTQNFQVLSAVGNLANRPGSRYVGHYSAWKGVNYPSD